MKLFQIFEELNISTPTGTSSTANNIQKQQAKAELDKGNPVKFIKKGEQIKEMARTSVVKYELKPNWRELIGPYKEKNKSGALLIEVMSRILNHYGTAMLKMDLVNECNGVFGRNIAPQLYRHYVENGGPDSPFKQYQQDIRTDYEVVKNIESPTLNKGIAKGREVIPKVLGSIDSSKMMTSDRRKIVEDVLKYKEFRNRYRELKNKADKSLKGDKEKYDKLSKGILKQMVDLVKDDSELGYEIAKQYHEGDLKVSDPITTMLFNHFKDDLEKGKKPSKPEKEPEDSDIEEIPDDFGFEDFEDEDF